MMNYERLRFLIKFDWCCLPLQVKTSIPFRIPSFIYGNDNDNGYNNDINYNDNNNNDNIIRSRLCFIPLALRRHLPQFTIQYITCFDTISQTH